MLINIRGKTEVLAEDGTIISQNNKKNFLVLNKELKNHISEIKKYIEDNHLTE